MMERTNCQKTEGLYHITTPEFYCSIWEIFRQSFLRNQKLVLMTLTNEDVPKIVLSVVKHELPTSYVAERYSIGVRRVQQLCKHFRDTGEFPILKDRGRKPYRSYPPWLEQRVLSLHNKHRCSAVYVGQFLRTHNKIQVDNNVIHRILKEHGMAQEDSRKQKRKRPWVRYERNHSLSLVHMDWSYNSHKKVWLCVVLDDASRMILSGKEFKRATATNSILLLKEAYKKYLHLAPIREVVTDHGAQFYANRRDKKGEAHHSFELFCRDMNIVHILASINHPQTNGKIEKWFHLYKRHRNTFRSFNEFIHWYNAIRPHRSLNFDVLETPKKAFYRKAEDLIMGN